MGLFREEIYNGPITVWPLLSGNSPTKSIAISSHGLLGLATICNLPSGFPAQPSFSHKQDNSLCRFLSHFTCVATRIDIE